MRDVPIDEFFSWRDDLAFNSYRAFDCHSALVNTSTYNEIKRRSDVQIPQSHSHSLLGTHLPPLNSITISIDDSIPSNILRSAKSPR